MRVNHLPAAHQVEDGVHHFPLQLLLLQVLVHRERHVQVEEVGGHVPEAGGRQPTGFLVPQVERTGFILGFDQSSKFLSMCTFEHWL